MVGTSWVTSVLGYLVAAGLVAEEWMRAGTLWPPDWAGRMHLLVAFLIAVWGRMQKDHNVTNAPMPADAMAVSPLVKT